MTESTSPGMPDELEISIGGYPGPFYSLSQANDTVVYGSRTVGEDSFREEVIIPTAEQWQSFWTALDKIGIWKWCSSYSTPDVLDGTGWSVKIVRGDRTIETGGLNGYPGGRTGQECKDDPTKRFNTFLRAVRDLVGGREFE